jgi:hypothetical protein
MRRKSVGKSKLPDPDPAFNLAGRFGFRNENGAIKKFSVTDPGYRIQGSKIHRIPDPKH